MKKNNLAGYLIIAALAVILIAASGLTSCKKEEGATFNTTALTMSFVQDAPPAELVPTKTYPIYVDIANLGGADIAPGAAHFYLSGFAPNLKNVNAHITNTNSLGKKTTIQEGGKERLVFAQNAQPVLLQSNFDFKAQLDSYYRYITYMQTSICVGKTGALCNTTGEKIKAGDNSAGPIQITSLTESVEGDKIYIRAKIENKGVGNVYMPNAHTDLLQADNINEEQKMNKVEVAVTTQEPGFVCALQSTEQPYGQIEAMSGMFDLSIFRAGTLTCYKTLEGETTHAAPFNIVLNYLYKESTIKSIKILAA
jgi:hypothetical protein